MLYLKLKSIAHREGDAVACLGHNSDVAVRMEMQLDDLVQWQQLLSRGEAVISALWVLSFRTTTSSANN